MPGPLLFQGVQVKCLHGGKAQPVMVNPKVLVNGKPIVLASSQYQIAGCGLPPPPGANGPCVTASFISAAVSVMSNGIPVLLMDSQAICVPTGTPLVIGPVPPRVVGR